MSAIREFKLRNTSWQESDSEGYVPFLYKYWFKGSKARQYLGFIKRPKIVMESLSCPSNSKILDVGCDWGYMVKLLESKGFDVYGIDINISSLIFGRCCRELTSDSQNNDSASLICGTAINLPFRDNSFSAIISLETIEHIHLDERKNFISELKRCVRREGQIILTTPNRYGISEIGKQIMSKFPILREKFGILGDIKNGIRLLGFTKKQTMINFPVSTQELRKIANSLGLKLIKHSNKIFVTKLCPEGCLGFGVLVESLLEKLPLIRMFGATSLYVFTK